MKLEILKDDFMICKLKNYNNLKIEEFMFLSKTDEEYSLLCKESLEIEDIIEKEDGYKGFRVVGILDFSLIGIISKITNILAINKIPVFVVSTYNTDYCFIKNTYFDKAIKLLKENDYEII